MKLSMLQWKTAFFVLLLLVGFGVAGVAVWYFTQPSANPVPNELRQQLTFSPLVVPASTSAIQTDSYKIGTTDDNTQLFSYIARGFGTAVTISQYVQPPQFTEVPEYKQKFLENKQDRTVQSANGTLNISRLSKQTDSEVAIMLERGLIVFLVPERTLSEAEWREIGDTLELQRM